MSKKCRKRVFKPFTGKFVTPTTQKKKVVQKETSPYGLDVVAEEVWVGAVDRSGAEVRQERRVALVLALPLVAVGIRPDETGGTLGVVYVVSAELESQTPRSWGRDHGGRRKGGGGDTTILDIRQHHSPVRQTTNL